MSGGKKNTSSVDSAVTSGSTTEETHTYTSDLEGLAGQTFSTPEEVTAAEQQLRFTQAEEEVNAIAQDPNTALTTSQQNITNYQAQIDRLNPETDADRIAELTSQMEAEQTNLKQANQLVAQNMQAEQRELVSSAVSDPSKIIEKAQVETTPVSQDQLVDQSVGDAGQVQTGEAQQVEQTATAETPARQAAAEADAITVGDKADEVLEGVSAATGEPSEKATVQGQLASLMEDFEGDGTPPWASGAMRKAMATMQSRGMGASSMAGAAVVQAAMESALSIASQDAQINAQFEMQNLNNEQQTTIFKTQQRLSSLFSDQAAENAAQQFNAASKNQTNQFFSNLEANASQFNAAQVNAIRQFNAGEANAMEEFNNTLRAQREQFNTQNALAISQANAKWRQDIATQDTAAKNIANLEYTKTSNAITGAALEQIWQRERDLMDYAFTSSENSMDRANAILLQKLAAKNTKEAMRLQEEIESKSSMGAFFGEVVTGLMGI